MTLIPLRRPLAPAVCVAVFSLFPAGAVGLAVNVRDFGAKGDGVAKDTAAVQAAVEKAAAAGGTVVLSPGSYLCGTIHLRSNLTLRLEQGARLLASPSDGDFDAYEALPYRATAPAKYRPRAILPANLPPVDVRRRSAPAAYDDEETNYFHYALLAGDGVRNVSIEGPGEIDGNRPRRYGPKPIAFKHSEWISIRGITVRNAPNYAISLGGTDHVEIDGVNILNAYADGIDPDGCHFVRIVNCYIDSHDDSICAKASWALGTPRSTENMVVANCILRTEANHIKFGSESAGGFKNVSIANCVLLDRDQGQVPDSGIALESDDGAHIDGVVISNISIRNTSTPLFIRLGNRGRGMDHPVPGSIENISIQNVAATGAFSASSITGLESAHVRNIMVDGFSVTSAGGGRARDVDVPELPHRDPDAAMFGTLPAFGFYARHVDGLTLKDLKVHAASPDGRSAVVLDDVARVELSGFDSTNVPAAQPLLLFRNVVGAFLFGNRLSSPAAIFLALEGENTRDVGLRGNDLAKARRPVDRSPEVPAPAVLLQDSMGRQ
ncbi:MAG: glycosyl hydrolase family 28-related protein [Bryobacteraceae bacterium]